MTLTEEKIIVEPQLFELIASLTRSPPSVTQRAVRAVFVEGRESADVLSDPEFKEDLSKQQIWQGKKIFTQNYEDIMTAYGKGGNNPNAATLMQFTLLTSYSRLQNKKIIQALRDYLVDGKSILDASVEHGFPVSTIMIRLEKMKRNHEVLCDYFNKRKSSC